MAEIANLAVLDANNTARFPEGQLVPTLNDGGRALEGILARWEKDTNGSIASSGSVNAFAILTNRVIPSHAAGNEFKFRATTANTGASTITINALAFKPLRRHGGSALQSGDIGTNQLVHVLYNSAGDYYECLGVSGGGGGDSLPSGGTTGQVLAKASNDDGDVEWTTAEGTGDMLASMYDPEGVEADAFDMDNMADGSSKVAMTTSERSKLSGIASGATANSSNATLLARANHTGTQAISTVDGLQTALDGKASTSHGIHVPTGGSTGQVLKKASGSDGDLEWAADNTGGGGGGLDNLVEDTSPQLGGDLDLNGHVITGMVIGTNVQAYSANLAEWSGINPSSNGGSLVAAADYAAMRALLDLEAGTDFLSPSAIAAAYQPLDSDLTAIAALTTTTAGLTSLTFADPNADRLMAWDDSVGAVVPIALADIATEAAPAAGDFLMVYLADGTLAKVDWDDLPAGGGGGSPGGSSGQIQFNNASSFDGALLWQSTNTIEQYNSTNAQSLWVYNTRTDGSNYERAGVRWNSNVLEVGTFAAGTGSAREFKLMRNGTTWLESGSNHLTTGQQLWSSNRLGIGSNGSSSASVMLLVNGDSNAPALRLLNGGGGSASIDFVEASADPSAPAANCGRLFLRDNGSSKTQLCVRFNTGAIQVIATEP